MAFVHDHSDATKNLGKWYSITFDDERNVPVSLRIRRLAREERKKIEKPYLRMRKGKRGGQKTLEIPTNKYEEFGIDCAVYMWTDIRNGYVQTHDNGSLSFYKKHLDNVNLKMGEDIKLDGKLTSEIKQRLIDQDNSISTFITEKGLLLDEEMAEADEAEAEVEEVAAENL